jgi:hypothetical protein
MPNITPSEVASAEPVQTVSTTSKAPIFSAPIFLEITRRNELRQVSKLPLLDASKEWRRLKAIEDARRYSELFSQFEAAYRQSVWAEMLKRVREAKSDPKWRPSCWSDGIGYQRHVQKIVRERFWAERQKRFNME